MRKQTIVPIAAGIMLALAGSAQAATKNTTFGVSATVAANCFISAADLAFGTYMGDTETPTNVDSSSDISVRCSKNAPYTLALSVGATPGSSYSTRLMAGPGSETLQYNLYTSSARTAVWGNGTGSSTVGGSGAGLGVTNTHTVFGRLFDNAANQAAAVGSYSDTIQVTVTY